MYVVVDIDKVLFEEYPELVVRRQVLDRMVRYFARPQMETVGKPHRYWVPTEERTPAPWHGDRWARLVRWAVQKKLPVPATLRRMAEYSLWQVAFHSKEIPADLQERIVAQIVGLKQRGYTPSVVYVAESTEDEVMWIASSGSMSRYATIHGLPIAPLPWLKPGEVMVGYDPNRP